MPTWGTDKILQVWECLFLNALDEKFWLMLFEREPSFFNWQHRP